MTVDSRSVPADIFQWVVICINPLLVLTLVDQDATVSEKVMSGFIFANTVSLLVGGVQSSMVVSG